ncbi:hypothetical protein [Paenibacillus alvei]|uniref:hypothetical protein n=1 Tax=Paenibacillus alvei TaxID=44250 RepID=UPI0013DD5C82|nr:hypothetical protein [Paenibacillus alvei]NEZ43799.1 hypothetical protein [Paenibacillus alvei]
MTEEKVLKLSELADDVELGREEHSTVYTVAELKREIIELGEPHHKYKHWYTIENQRWEPSAERMIEDYIDNQYPDMYEGWEERASDCITEDVLQRLQAILDEAFSSDHATVYWTFEEPVEIDVFPNED